MKADMRSKLPKSSLSTLTVGPSKKPPINAPETPINRSSMMPSMWPSKIIAAIHVVEMPIIRAASDVIVFFSLPTFTELKSKAYAKGFLVRELLFKSMCK